MLNKLNIYSCIVFFFLIPLQKEKHSYQNYYANNYSTIKHVVTVQHPGEKEPTKVVLTQVKNAAGITTEYFIDVQSVICLENVCKVIPVRMYWNAIGEYQRYTLQKGATLEKYEADVFAPKDYDKLHTILKNKKSPFKEVYIEDVLTVKNELSDNIDAISGATALDLAEENTVPGAALTCFTLWHWANGEIISITQQITASTATDAQLLTFINKKNTTYYTLALAELSKRKLYKNNFLNAIFKNLKETQKEVKPTINYLEGSPKNTYLKTIKKLFIKGSLTQKIAALKSIENTTHNIKPKYLDCISGYAGKLKTYQEIAALLQMLESKNYFSKKTADNLVPLLNSDFLIARGVYWYLRDKSLNPQQKKNVTNLKNQHKNKL